MPRPIAALLFLMALTPVVATAESADLKVTVDTPVLVARASKPFYFYVGVENLGPDAAAQVTLSATFNVPGNCEYTFPNSLNAGEQRSWYCMVQAPSNDGALVITAKASSATPDPNVSNNTATATVAVTTHPDFYLSAGAPSIIEPGFPFNFVVWYPNYGGGPADDTTLHISLPQGVKARNLPSSCSAPGDGYVTCHLGTVPVFVLPGPAPNLTIELLAPDTHGGGTLPFWAEISSSLPDIDPSNNIQRWTSILYRAFIVDSAADAGTGSLRQALTDANAQCSSGPCELQFRFTDVTRFVSIRPQTPLPMITANSLLIDGTTQARWGSDTNPEGPEIEINGSEQGEGDGLVVESPCDSRIIGLVLNGFPGSAIRLRSTRACDPITFGYAYPRTVVANYIGVDPSGTTAVPNLRGITIEPGASYSVEKNVISGNTRSALFIDGPNTAVRRNIIGLNARATAPLGNGASGIFVSKNAPNTDIAGNVIAFNHEFGIAIERGARLTEIHGNSIHANWQPGIDIGLDGPTAATDDPAAPEIDRVHYDAATNTTIIEGTSYRAVGTFGPLIRLFANDAPDRSGFGQGQYFLGETFTAGVPVAGGYAFSFTWPGDLRGKFIAATATRVNYYGWLRVGDPRPDESSQGFERQTSEFSRTVEVLP